MPERKLERRLELKAYFDSDGCLAREVSDFVVREQQLEMAIAVAQSIDDGNVTLVEAGTGTGKTFAYLVPLFLSKKKLLISTGTKTLQDQLRFQDLPLLTKLFPEHHVALLKGRSNYLCPHRLYKHLQVMTGSEKTMTGLVEIRLWSERTKTGDLGEMQEIEDQLLPFVTSTRENCLGSNCPKYSVCPLYAARHRAQEADVVVVNHHLLFADLALKEDSINSILPLVEAIVVDEAHQLPEIARQFFGASIGSRRFTDLIRDLQSEMFLLGNDDPRFLSLIGQLDTAVSRMVRLILAGAADYDQWFQQVGQAVVEEVDHALADVLDVLEVISIRSQGLESCKRRTQQLIDEVALLTEPTALDEYIHWIDKSRHGFNIHLSPVDIARTIGPLFCEGFSEGKTAWIFTSATLCVDGTFAHIKQTLGVEQAVEKRFPGTFDFRRQVKALVPNDLPTPGSDHHTQLLVDEMKPILRQNQGRTFFLFTSYRAMNFAKELFAAEGGEFNVLVQGSLPRQQLIALFRKTERSILLATHSFWQGIDVRGARLNCVIIDKLPFASPDEPLTRATMRAIAARGGNGFIDYLLPQAVILLNQGFGRLIRAETDRGLFVLGDPRVNSRSYGSVVLASLPDMEWIETSEAGDYMREISEYPGD